MFCAPSDGIDSYIDAPVITAQVSVMRADPPVEEGVSVSVSQADLRTWRDRIDAIDREILRLVNERSGVANVIGHIKQQLGIPVYAPQREQEVILNVTEANEGPLTADAIRRIFERLIDETRSLERQRYQELSRK